MCGSRPDAGSSHEPFLDLSLPIPSKASRAAAAAEAVEKDGADGGGLGAAGSAFDGFGGSALMAADVLAHLSPEMSAPHEGVKLTACLQSLSAPEKLEGENAYVCDECDKRAKAQEAAHPSMAEGFDAPSDATAGAKADAKPRQPALRYIQLSRVPRVLTLHLKRFRSTGRRVHKLDEHVPFPRLLDLAPFAATSITHPKHMAQLAGGGGGGGAGGNVGSSGAASAAAAAGAPSSHELRLYAVVEHQGSFSGGHYIAYVRLGCTWFRMSDSAVSEVDEAEVLQKQAFMLFYERVG